MGTPLIWIIENKYFQLILIIAVLAGFVLGAIFCPSKNTRTASEPPPIVAIPPEDPNKLELQNFLSSWESAWETKDLPYLMSMYSPQFQGRGQNYQSLQGYFYNVFYHSSSIELSLHDFRVLSISDSSASLRFVQVMTIDGASDRGVVTMHLEKVYEGWLITSEEWRAL